MTEPSAGVMAFESDLSITCPAAGWLDGGDVRVEFDWATTVEGDELRSASIDYGDGRVFAADAMAVVEQDMFWHHYEDLGRYDVEVVFEHDAGTSSASCSFSVKAAPWVETVPAPSPLSSPTPASGGAAGVDGCDVNYEGACVPIASDVDCAGGSGNGPAYVAGPVRVVGTDIHDLDRDGNGIGCE